MNLKHEIEKITDGYGCNVYFEVTGNPISVQQGLDILTRQGRFICMSIFKKDVPADWSLIGTYLCLNSIQMGKILSLTFSTLYE